MRSHTGRPCTKTQGSIIALSEHPDGVHNILVTSNPAPIEARRALNRREHLVCRMSMDGGKTWPKSLVVEPANAGYSTLINLVYWSYHRKEVVLIIESELTSGGARRG